MVDPVLVGIAAVLVALVIFLYLMVRRTITGFREGMDEAGNDGR